jgi:excisionase family DNA binding protein
MGTDTSHNPPPRLTITVDEKARLLLTANGADDGEKNPRLLLSTSEVAERLSMGRSFVQELVTRGEIASVKLGKARRISVRSLEAYVRRLEENSP